MGSGLEGESGEASGGCLGEAGRGAGGVAVRRSTCPAIGLRALGLASFCLERVLLLFFPMSFGMEEGGGLRKLGKGGRPSPDQGLVQTWVTFTTVIYSNIR